MPSNPPVHIPVCPYRMIPVTSTSGTWSRGVEITWLRCIFSLLVASCKNIQASSLLPILCSTASANSMLMQPSFNLSFNQQLFLNKLLMTTCLYFVGVFPGVAHNDSISFFTHIKLHIKNHFKTYIIFAKQHVLHCIYTKGGENHNQTDKLLSLKCHSSLRNMTVRQPHAHNQDEGSPGYAN